MVIRTQLPSTDLRDHVPRLQADGRGRARRPLDDDYATGRPGAELDCERRSENYEAGPQERVHGLARGDELIGDRLWRYPSRSRSRCPALAHLAQGDR
jgi:hypothetical protein